MVEGEKMAERVANALMSELYQRGVDCGDLKLKHLYLLARVAIAAMREPTEEMVTAARQLGSASRRCIWHTMIDEALH